VAQFLESFHELRFRVDEALTASFPLTREVIESLRVALEKGRNEDEARAQKHQQPDALEIVTRAYRQLEERLQVASNAPQTQSDRQAPDSARHTAQGRPVVRQRIFGKQKSLRSRPEVVVLPTRNDPQGSMTDREFLRHVVALSEQAMVVGTEGRRRRSLKRLCQKLEECFVVLSEVWGRSVDLPVRNDMALIQAAIAFLKESSR
jgi:hypothetical protein